MTFLINGISFLEPSRVLILPVFRPTHQYTTFKGVILHEFSTKIHTLYRGATPIMLKGYMWSCPGRAARPGQDQVPKYPWVSAPGDRDPGF